MENIPEASVQSDSQREASASDSDSGGSLFLTQSVTPASRTVKRRRPSTTQACPYSQESEDEQERDGDPNEQHEIQSDSDSETSYADLLRRWKSPVKGVGRQPRPRHKRTPPKGMVLPFLKNASRQLFGRKHKTVVNSEIGGFFKCVLKLSKGHGERRRELSPSLLDSDRDVRENEEDENEDDDEDIRKVNADCFILRAHKRNRQTWLPSLKWKTRQTPRKCTKKSTRKGQDEHKKCYETRKVAEDPMESQDDTEMHNECSSLNKKVSQSRKNCEKSRKSPARSSVLPHSSPSDRSPFVQSLFMDHQEEHGENHSQVLVTCSQSQSLDWHQTQKIDQTCENLMEPIDEMAVEETQWPSLTYQDEDETQILEDNPTDRAEGEDALCSANISFHEHQLQEEDIRGCVPHEPVENEDFGSVSGGFISSQDLFQEPNHQASPLKETCVENDNEVLESRVVLSEEKDSVMKKRRSLILADVDAGHVTDSKPQRTQLTEIISPTAGDVWQEIKEKDKKISDKGVEHVCPSLPLEDYTSGSRGNDFSSPSKDILTVRQEEKTENPLFIYLGLKFIKRKPSTNNPADNPAPIQADQGQNEGSARHIDDMVKQKKRKRVKNDRLLEETVDTLPEISVPADPSLSVQQCSVVCPSVSGIKPKKKIKKDKHGLLERSVDTLPEISAAADSSVSFQDSSMVSVSVGRSKPKKKRKKKKHGQPVPQEDQWIGVEEVIQIPCQGSDSLMSMSEETEQLARTDLSSPSMSHEVSQLDSNIQVNKDLVQSDGLQPRRKKKKKVKKRDSSPMMSDEMGAPQCSEESHPRYGTKSVKKKKQRFIDGVGEGQVGEMTTASKDLDEALDKILEIRADVKSQPMNSIDLKADDAVTQRKKKKRKRQESGGKNVDIETSLEETKEQVEIPDSFQDSEQKTSEVVPVEKVKKKKKIKDRSETCQENEASKNGPVALGLVLGDMTTSNTPSEVRSETGGIGEEEGLDGSEPVKKKKKKRKELEKESSCRDVRENEEDENEDDDEDIRKVNADCFILRAHKRNRQTWLPSLKWKTRQTPRKCTKKSTRKGQDEHKKCYETRKVAEDPMEPQDDTEMHNECSSLNKKVSQSRKNCEKSRKSPARSSVLPHSSPSDRSPFVQSLFMDHQEEHGENHSQVLVTCSQSQSLDWHQTQKIDQTCENLMEPIDEMAVEETQWPCLTYQDEDETQILEDNPTDRAEGEDALCSANISFHEHQLQEEDIRGCPLKETCVENDNEVLESRVVLSEEKDSVMKKRRSLILADVDAGHVTDSKPQRTQLTEIISPTAGDVWQEIKEKDKKISDKGVEHVCPSLPLEDYTSGSRGNDFSSPSKDILTVRQEESPLFIYLGLKFLKRKKGKKTGVLEFSDNPAPIQADQGQNKSSARHIDDMVKQKKRKRVKNDRLLEETVDTLPEISVPADPSLSLQQCSVVCPSVSGIKPKKKIKKDKNGLLERSVDTLPEISAAADSSVSFQDSSMVSVSVGRSKPKKKRKKDKHGQPVPQEDQWIGVEELIQIPCQGSDSLMSMSEETEQLARTDLSSPSMSHEVSQLDSDTQVNKDIVQSDGLQPRRKKKKKVKKRDSSPMMSDEMGAPQCSEESHPRYGTKSVKKKKQRFIDGVGEGQVGEMTTASKDLDEALNKILEIRADVKSQPMNSIDLKADDAVTQRKKKKRKRKEEVGGKNVDIEASLEETKKQVEIPDSFQDSEQKTSEVVPVEKVKKKKKIKDRSETCQENEASKNGPVALGLVLRDMTTSNTPSEVRSETGGIGEEEGLDGSEPVKKKKKKKKRKELEKESSWSVSHDVVYLNNTEQITVVKEASSRGQKLGKGKPAPCLEMQLTKKKCDRTKGGSSECSPEILQSEDIVQPKGRKKRKKRLLATDLDLYPEVVEHDMCQENGPISECPEAVTEKKKKKKKKKKNRKDTGENKILGVEPELSAVGIPGDVLVTCHVKEDSISSSGGELLVNIKKKKKKKQVRD